MSEFKERIDALASLMEEYRLTEAVFEDGPFRVVFRRHGTPVAAAPVAPIAAAGAVAPVDEVEESFEETASAPAAPVGTPITTPMGGIFYDAPSPSSPPFVKEGDVITTGQVIGLIEAMKVFNEIPSPVSGTVKKVVVEAGSVVNVGDSLMLVG